MTYNPESHQAFSHGEQEPEPGMLAHDELNEHFHHVMNDVDEGELGNLPDIARKLEAEEGPTSH